MVWLPHWPGAYSGWLLQASVSVLAVATASTTPAIQLPVLEHPIPLIRAAQVLRPVVLVEPVLTPSLAMAPYCEAFV